MHEHLWDIGLRETEMHEYGCPIGLDDSGMATILASALRLVGVVVIKVGFSCICKGILAVDYS